MALPLVWSGCSSGGGDGKPAGAASGDGNNRLIAVRYGRNAEVLGYRRVGEDLIIQSFAQDVLIGPDIEDERPAGSQRGDEEILYDFLLPDLDTLTPRLLIPREIGSREFDDAFAALDDRAPAVTPSVFGQDTSVQPFPVVPRNAVIELRFSEPLGLSEEFFIERDANGTVVGQRNSEAVQLLEILDDPTQGSASGTLRPIDARLRANGDRLLIDPVLLGSEGQTLQLRTSATGLPASADQLGANIRIALALDGPFAIPGLARPADEQFVGTNSDDELAIIRDFRSGNDADQGASLSRGFALDRERPRLLGELPMRLARVDRPGSGRQTITIFKNGLIHEIDQGDGVRIVDPSTRQLIGRSEVRVDPMDDELDPAVQSVRTRIDPIEGLEAFDPTNDPSFPTGDPDAQARFLDRNAPLVILTAQFTAFKTERVRNPSAPRGDDLANFVRFVPSALPAFDGPPAFPNENISPFAEAELRFTKPVDLETIRVFETLFFAARNVIDRDVILSEYVLPRGINPDEFNFDKYATPHLIAARLVDQDGSSTRLRLQPRQGFYLDSEMRQADAQAIAAQSPGDRIRPEERPFPYFLHIVGGPDGIRDLAGNTLDFDSDLPPIDFQVLPFAIDTRLDESGQPLFADNLVTSIVHRFANEDEDAHPSVFRYQDGEQPMQGSTGSLASAAPSRDVFGDVTYLADGRLLGRTSSRFRRIVDNLNQVPAPPQATYLQYCPDSVGDSAGTGVTSSAPASTTGSSRNSQPEQNPLNPYGARLQTVWREIDLGLSRFDPNDFDLDVEGMYWAPFRGADIVSDEFDSVSLLLGHAESRPNPCLGEFSAVPVLPESGLNRFFDGNYVRNILPNPSVPLTEEQETGHPAYTNAVLRIEPSAVLLGPNRVNRFLPLPQFQEPFFVWRDQTVMLQGGNQRKGNDVSRTGNGTPGNLSMRPFIPSPWLGGFGTAVVQDGPTIRRAETVWQSTENFRLSDDGATTEPFTDGLLASIALPLLADFQTGCDDPNLPVGNGFLASGANGWQTAFAAAAFLNPNAPAFRAFSGGFEGDASNPSLCVAPGSPSFVEASGGVAPPRPPVPTDTSVYWIMADFARRQTVATFGFVDVLDPHRRIQGPAGAGTAPTGDDVDPRLGPFFFDSAVGRPVLPGTLAPQYDALFEPPLSRQPDGTSVIAEFRAASAVSELPWRWDRKRLFLTVRGLDTQPSPSAVNFPNDPLKACDAHIRKFDDRPTPTGAARNFWTYYYNDTVTDYTTDVTELSNAAFLSGFAGPNETFGIDDVRYVNWRFVMANSKDVTAPALESFALSIRFGPR